MAVAKITKDKWIMPRWMEPYRELITNTGGNGVEDLVNGDASPLINLPLSTLQACAQSQVSLLEHLYQNNKLATAATTSLLHRFKQSNKELRQRLNRHVHCDRQKLVDDIVNYLDELDQSHAATVVQHRFGG